MESHQKVLSILKGLVCYMVPRSEAGKSAVMASKTAVDHRHSWSVPSWSRDIGRYEPCSCLSSALLPRSCFVFHFLDVKTKHFLSKKLHMGATFLIAMRKKAVQVNGIFSFLGYFWVLFFNLSDINIWDGIILPILWGDFPLLFRI